MLKLLRKKRGQNTAEYAILIGVIVAAAIAMQIYIRRGMQGRIKDAVDYTLTADDNATGINDDLNLFTHSQYEPYYTSTNFATEQSGTTTQAIAEGEYIKNITESQTRVGNQVYTNWETENLANRVN